MRSERSAGPAGAAAQAEPEEAALELPGDEVVVGADEMQHLHDLAVAGHRAAGREGHGEARRHEHQRDEDDADRR